MKLNIVDRQQTKKLWKMKIFRNSLLQSEFSNCINCFRKERTFGCQEKLEVYSNARYIARYFSPLPDIIRYKNKMSKLLNNVEVHFGRDLILSQLTVEII